LSVPDGSTPGGTGRFGADVFEMEGSAKRTDELAGSMSRDLYPAILPIVAGTVRSNLGLPGFSSMGEFFDVAVRAAVDEVAQDLTAQAATTHKGAVTFQQTDDKLRAQADKISDGVEVA
jgi:hypothetical protein